MICSFENYILITNTISLGNCILTTKIIMISDYFIREYQKINLAIISRNQSSFSLSRELILYYKIQLKFEHAPCHLNKHRVHPDGHNLESTSIHLSFRIKIIQNHNDFGS